VKLGRLGGNHPHPVVVSVGHQDITFIIQEEACGTVVADPVRLNRVTVVGGATQTGHQLHGAVGGVHATDDVVACLSEVHASVLLLVSLLQYPHGRGRVEHRVQRHAVPVVVPRSAAAREGVDDARGRHFAYLVVARVGYVQRQAVFGVHENARWGGQLCLRGRASITRVASTPDAPAHNSADDGSGIYLPNHMVARVGNVQLPAPGTCREGWAVQVRRPAQLCQIGIPFIACIPRRASAGKSSYRTRCDVHHQHAVAALFRHVQQLAGVVTPQAHRVRHGRCRRHMRR
jgi:hypothetical protein